MGPSSQLVLLCSFFFFIYASTAHTSPRPKELVLPVFKDAATLQYIIQLKQRTPLIPINLTVDLGARFVWLDCHNGYKSSTFKTVRCGSPPCSLADSHVCEGGKTCILSPGNPFIHTSTDDRVAQDVVSLQSTDGFSSGRLVKVPDFIFSCAPSSLLRGLAKGVKGMAAFGRSKVSLPSQLSSAFNLKRKFAFCLSSSSFDNGVIFFGDGPYTLAQVDASKSLSYTPLLINPVSTALTHFQGDVSVEYFVGLKSIKVSGKSVPINTALLSIDKNGYGGTKISTVHPFSVFETSIYNAVVEAFTRTLSVPRVSPVAPFKTCFNISNISFSPMGPGVPGIDLVFQNDQVVWKMIGANLMQTVKNDVICLAFVDGGLKPRTSIVIGGFQLENNLLEFDLAKSRLGFSSHLFLQRTNCVNFNFTS